VANVYLSQGKYGEAEGLYQRALAIREKALGRDHLEVANSLIGLAFVYRDQGRYGEAEGVYQRALAIKEKALGRDHHDVANPLIGLATVYRDQGRYGEAEGLDRRALAIYEKARGQDHPDVAGTLDNLAILFAAAGNRDTALVYSRRATAAVIAHAAIEAPGAQQKEQRGGLIEQRAEYFLRHVANLAAAPAGSSPPPALGHEAFEIAQWGGRSVAAAALQQMSTRIGSGTDVLARVIREKQDLAAAWHGKDKALLAALVKPEGQQGRAPIEVLRREIGDIERRLAAIAAQLEREFPEYAALASPRPFKVEEVQTLLETDEALVFFLMSGTETYVFAQTRERFEWRTIPVGWKALVDKVTALRSGLDVDGLNRATKAGTKPEPFDLGVAHELYTALFSAIEPVIKDKRHLLVVPSGPLTALPFYLLVTQKPAAAASESPSRYREAAWLLKRHAMSVLPSVASLKALRQYAKKSTAAKPYIAFGNPLLLGPDGTDTGAWDRQRCPRDAPRVAQRVARAGKLLPGISSLFRGNLADVAEVQRLDALPETSEELCEVARRLGVPESEIWLGERATESNVKEMSEQGRLASYGIVHFATHGLVTGELKGLAEPALVLTPPAKASEIDDGLLTASEVAQLKLNADWVVLSACNTAAAGEQGAEALSGLARAFFYAGARALLVSHWKVHSEAAVRLTTKAFSELRANPRIGRAEALRRAMIDVIKSGADNEAHPAYWAPFFVVGEGGSLTSF
jgi:CHAT domain-containing protein/Tfp pilus assembly protein PilF